MPVRGPALIHDLTREDRIEIKRLFANREEDVALPWLHLGRVLRDEPQQVTFGMRRDRRLLPEAGLLRPNRVRTQRGKAFRELAIHGDRSSTLDHSLGITRSAQTLIYIDVLF